MKHVISVSLGSSKGDLEEVVTLLGKPVKIRRIGTNGSLANARQLIRDHDGVVDAFGLGGIDRWVIAGGRRYEIRDARNLAACAKNTPVLDGSGLKDTLEREMVRAIADLGIMSLKGTKTFLVSAVDRFGMAEELEAQGTDLRCGDLLAVGCGYMLTSTSQLDTLARVSLPLLTKLPFKLLYPTGKKQDVRKPYGAGARQCEWADLIAGDYHYIHRYLPVFAHGKTVLTNTTRPDRIAFLRSAGVRRVITTTPQFPGGSFGTNAIEAALVAIMGGELPATHYVGVIRELGWKPQVMELTW